MRASIRRAMDREGGGLDWLSAPEVDYVATATTPHQDAPAHVRILRDAIRCAEQKAAENPGALFGVFLNVGADGAVSYDVTSDEPEYVACAGLLLEEVA